MDTRSEIFELVRAADKGITAEAISKSVKRSMPTVYQHLNALKKKHEVENENGLWYPTRERLVKDTQTDHSVELELLRAEVDDLKESRTHAVMAIESALYYMNKGLMPKAEERLANAVKLLQ